MVLDLTPVHDDTSLRLRIQASQTRAPDVRRPEPAICMPDLNVETLVRLDVHPREPKEAQAGEPSSDTNCLDRATVRVRGEIPIPPDVDEFTAAHGASDRPACESRGEEIRASEVLIGHRSTIGYH